MLDVIGAAVSLMVVLGLAALALVVLSVVVLACLAGLAATTYRESRGDAAGGDRGGHDVAGDEERESGLPAAHKVLKAHEVLKRRVGRAVRAMVRPAAPDGRAPGREDRVRPSREGTGSGAARSGSGAARGGQR